MFHFFSHLLSPLHNKLPDTPRYWMDKIPGENWLRVVPNADHTMVSAYLEIASDISAFFNLVTRNISRPQVVFYLNRSSSTSEPASIVAQVYGAVPTAQVWSAVTPASSGRRDFRWFICGKLSPQCSQVIPWLPESLSGSSPAGLFQVKRSAPTEGSWQGFLIQLNFNVSNQPFRVTSQLNVVPDTWPFPPCSPSECG